MNGEVAVVLAVLAALALVAIPLSGEKPRFAPPPAAVLTVALVLLGLAAVLARRAPAAVGTDEDLGVLLVGAAAVLAGGPVTDAVLKLADRSSPGTLVGADVLRGGAWIGILERVAVAAAVLYDRPDVLTVIFVIKGFGRYPELRQAIDPNPPQPPQQAPQQAPQPPPPPTGTGTPAATPAAAPGPPRDPDRSAAERFIIGTFASVLWAAGVAGVGILLLR